MFKWWDEDANLLSAMQFQKLQVQYSAEMQAHIP